MNFKMNYIGCTTCMLDSKLLTNKLIPYGGIVDASRELLEAWGLKS